MPDTNFIDTNFIPGETLVWMDQSSSRSAVTRRIVAFRGMKNHLCEVAWGLRSDGTGNENLYSVPRSELTRPETPIPVPSVTRHEPEPVISLEQRRTNLAHALSNYQDATRLVGTAQVLLDRAWDKLEATQTRLRQFNDLEKQAVDAVLDELRHMNGNTYTPTIHDATTTNDNAEWTQRECAVRECRAAETAYETLARELSDAKSMANDRLKIMERAAAHVVACIIEQETQQLALLESKAIELRAQLRAAATMWISEAPVPVNQTASTILANFPYDQQDPIGTRMQLAEARQAPFHDLYEKLVSGDVEATLID